MDIFIALIIFLFPLAYSPGPGNMFFAANGARYGIRATLKANLGYHLATLIVTLSIGGGFSWILGHSSWIALVVKTLGAAYVFWIAAQMFMAMPSNLTVKSSRINAWDGAVLLLLNPKAYVIITLMFSQFLPTGGDKNLGLILVISTVFTLNNFVAFLVWGMVGDVLARWFRDEKHAVWLNRSFGLLLAGVALWMLII